MNWFRRGDALDRAFAAGIILKGLDGLLEIVGGLLLLVLRPGTIDRLVVAVTQHELSEDPHDVLANRLLQAAGGVSGPSLRFGAVYLLSHGLVKAVLVGAVLRNRLWAYPWMIAFLVAFIAYQVYRMALAFSPGLLALTLFDLAVVWLTYREYTKQRASRAAPGH